MSNKIITRFPPSPTGPLHIGNVRTALFNYLFAKHNGGDFIVRVEDTDKARSKKEYEEDMLQSLEWLGLKKDGELWHQSERTEIYKKYLKILIDEKKVYLSVESEGENREVIRFSNPNIIITFNDLIRGEVQFDTTELGDFIIAKNIDEPLYHMAVVVDDFEANITHVVRGEDHISNTPRQILIQEAIGAPRPIYVHLPLILASDRSKLSKRRHGETVSLDYYQKKGYLPEAILNYMALLGWNPGTEQEIFTLDELIQEFDISRIHKGGAIFDEKKLEWMNKEHIKRLPEEERKKILLESLKHEPYLTAEPELDREKISWKKVSREETARLLVGAKKIIEEDGNLMAYAEREGKGNVLWPVRYALTGADASPDPFTILEILGKEKSLKRIERAIAIMRE
jgi:glutamyl/glutaminyl-tRNA synthetase